MDKPSTHSVVGSEIAGRYRIISRIADGGMATVFLGHDERLDRDVAVKIMHDDIASDVESRRRFLREALSSAKLSHPNVVSIYDHGVDGSPFIVMEYLPGKTLRQLIRQRGKFTVQESLDVIIAILSGLAAAHRAGIIHRDLKPENIILTDDGRAKVADFGLARPTDNHTDSGESLFGTVAYLSPELVNRAPADTRSDVYAVGIMLYEMLTGKQPFTGDQPVQVAMQHLNTPTPLPSASVPDIPESVDDLVLWATAKDPDERPRDASEMLSRARVIAQQVSGNSPSQTRLLRLPNTPTTPMQAVEKTTVLPTAGTANATAVKTELFDEIEDVAEPAPEAVLTAKSKRRRKAGWIWFAVVLALAGIAAVVAWYFAAGPGARVLIPNLIGKTSQVATSTLTAKQLRVTNLYEHSVSVPKGVVIRTSPVAGKSVKIKSTVRVVVSDGPGMKVIPGVEGLPSTTAQSQLEDAGFKVDPSIDSAYTNETPANAVIRIYSNDQRVKAGDRIVEGSTIKLLVSLGAVPDFSGKTLDAVQDQLRSLNLVAGDITKQFSDTVPNGTVISSSTPKAVTRTGGKVNLVVSKGQDLVTVPDTSSMNVADAMKAINDAGLTAETAVPDVVQPMAQVQSTDPGAGTQIKRGSKVTVAGTL